MRQAVKHHPLRVLVLTPFGPNGPGGIDRLWDKVYAELARHPVDGLSVRSLTTRGPYPGRTGTYLIGGLYFAVALCAATASLLFGRVDVVHINLASDGSTVRKLRLAALARFFGVPYVIHLHGAEFHQFWGRSSPRMARAIRHMFESASATIVLGSFWRSLIAERAPGARDRIVVLANATAAPSRERPVRDGAGCRILFLGRLEPRKGVPQLLEALTRLRDVPGWTATLAGDGDVAGTRAAIAAAGLDGRVDVPGWIDETAVQQKLSVADILVLPSLDEGLPVAVVEAFGHGVAVVTTPVGAIPDIVKHEVTGLLVPPGKAEPLADALARLIGDEALRDRLGANARRLHRSKLDLGSYVKRLTEIWTAAADGRGRTATDALDAVDPALDPEYRR